MSVIDIAFQPTLWLREGRRSCAITACSFCGSCSLAACSHSFIHFSFPCTASPLQRRLAYGGNIEARTMPVVCFLCGDHLVESKNVNCYDKCKLLRPMSTCAYAKPFTHLPMQASEGAEEVNIYANDNWDPCNEKSCSATACLFSGPRRVARRSGPR
jgi:hypothetical protein